MEDLRMLAVRLAALAGAATWLACATYAPPLYGRSEVEATIAAKWVGACK
jgi:hypothetical protein